MNHFIKNLILFPFKLVWDVLLILAVVILQIIWLGFLFGTFGLWLVIGLFSFEVVACLIMPLYLLVYLKNPWPNQALNL